LPRAFVIVPTHNRLATLKGAVESVHKQTFRDLELIIVDDGSTDGTASWAAGADASLIKIPAPGRGAAAARNRALQTATGEFIAFLDDDDRWRPAYLAAQVAQLDAHPEAQVSIAGHVEVHASGATSQPLLKPAYAYSSELAWMLAECPIHTLSAAVCRRTAFERVGLLDESLRIVHDLEWYVRVIQAGGKFVSTPEVLVEHAVPGGLVTRHRDWFYEERKVRQQCTSISARERDVIGIARELFFARTSLANGDAAFAFARAITGFAKGPRVAASMIAQRLRQRRQFAKMEETQ